jgi:hypothetical protein
MEKREVSCYQEYFGKARERSVDMGIKVSENMQALKNIEKSMMIEPKPLEPLQTMIS